MCSIVQETTYNNDISRKSHHDIPIYACGYFLYINMASLILLVKYSFHLVKLISTRGDLLTISSGAQSILDFCQLELDKSNNTKQASLQNVLLEVSKNGLNESTDKLAQKLNVVEGYDRIKQVLSDPKRFIEIMK
jgi:hypothetical protein